MKKTLLFLFAMLLIVDSYSQKVDIDKYTYKVKYRDMPRKPLSPEYRTQLVKVTGSEKIMHYLDNDDLANRAAIPGFKRVVSDVAHVVINLNAGNLVVTDVQFPKKEYVNKNKDGKEISRTISYSVDVSFEWKGSVTVLDYKDSVICSYEEEKKDVLKIDKSFASISSAAEYWNKNKAGRIKELVQEKVPRHISSMCTSYRWDLGYFSKNENEFLWIVASKKHPEYAPQQMQIEKIRTAFEAVTLTDFPEEAKKTILEVIAYYNDIPSRFTSDDKSDKKLRYASFYNTAKLYYWLDRPEDARREAEMLIANGFDIKDGEKIMEDSRALAESMQKTQHNSRHFDPEKMDVQLPEVARMLD